MIGIPHPALGEEVGAAVALKPGATATPEELRDFVKARVAAYKYPRHVWLVDALPKGPTGKILQARDRAPADDASRGGERRDDRGHSRAAHRRAPSATRRRRRAAGPAAHRRRARPAAPVPARHVRRCGSPPAWPRRPRPRRPAASAAWPASWPDRASARSELGAARAGPPVRRPGLDAEPAAAPDRAGLPGRRRDGARAGRRRRPRLARRPSGCGSSSTTSSRRWRRATSRCSTRRVEGGDRHRRAAASSRAPAAGRATWPAPPRVPAMVEPDAFEVGEDLAVTPGRGGAAHRRVRADPVHAADRRGPRGPAADRAADDQQVLRPRPRPGPQPGRVPRRPGPAGVRDLLAQPGRPARRLGPRHLRPGDPRRAGRRRADHRQPTQAALLGVCSGGILAAMAAGAPRRDRRAGPGGRASASRVTVLDQAAGRHCRRAASTRRPPRRPRPRRGRRATSTAGRWPRCSPGCGPTT